MAWTHKDIIQFASGTATNTTSQSWPLGAVPSGDIVVVGLWFTGTTGAITVSDNQSNTYTQIGTAQSAAGGSMTMWFSQPITNGPTALTVNTATNWSFIELVADSYAPPTSGAVTLDGNVFNSVSGSGTQTGTSITTTKNGDLVTSVAGVNTMTTIGWTQPGSTGFMTSSWTNQASAGSINASWTSGGSGGFFTAAISSPQTAAIGTTLILMGVG